MAVKCAMSSFNSRPTTASGSQNPSVTTLLSSYKNMMVTALPTISGLFMSKHYSFISMSG